MSRTPPEPAQMGPPPGHGATAPNAHRLLWAGFMAILAAGVGFSIRAGILGQWQSQYGFTASELGVITGGGLTGFGIIILIGAMLADRVGYGTLMVTAFGMHLASAALTLATGAAYAAGGKPLAFQCLFWGMFLFAIGNGIAESVVNPLVATLFPRNQTHYLNILHAGWPAGLVLGGLLSTVFTGDSLFGWKPLQSALDWKYQISLFLVPVALYGILMVGQRFPKSEASQQGVPYRSMLRELGILGGGIILALLGVFLHRDLGLPLIAAVGITGGLWLAFSYAIKFSLGPILLAVLLITHAMVGYVELGTDSWIVSIVKMITTDQRARLLFVYTSSLMFVLRFFAGPIVERISPLGLLFFSAVLGAVGLTMLSFADTLVLCLVALTIYGFGKTFLWPTMLAVVSEQFPRGGAITIGAVGGVGMLSAGLLGGPGIGFKQDYYAAEELREAPAVYERYKAPEPNQFMGITTVGLDGSKVGLLEAYKVEDKDGVRVVTDEGGEKARADLARLEDDKNASSQAIEEQRGLVRWWEQARESADQDRQTVVDASLTGGRMALRLTALVPATMALIYLGIIFYFQSRGGYRPKTIHHSTEPGEGERKTGGVAGPSEF